MKKTVLTLAVAAALTAGAIAPTPAIYAKSATGSHTDMGQVGGDKRAAMQALLAANGGKFMPQLQIIQAELVDHVAKLINKKPIIVQTWVNNYEGDKPATRGQATRLVIKAMKHLPSAAAVVTDLEAVNPITLQVTFSAPLTADDVNLEQAKKNFQFDNGMTILNVPQLKNGAVSTYIVPVTVQKPGSTYTLSYKGKAAGSFKAATNKIELSSSKQVAMDTFELESFRDQGVTDYAYIVEAYYGSRGGQEMSLDVNNRYHGRPYQIISSLRDKQVTITPEGGQPIMANYVPYTQATDGRQAPKFRLAGGAKLQAGVKYTVSSEWATVKEASFIAKTIAPLEIAAVTAQSETELAVKLSMDPMDELFSGRSVTLTDADGTVLTAAYKVTTRKGDTGTFTLAGGAKLAKGVKYEVEAAGGWAVDRGVTITLN
ncbi:hypothetical protein ACFO9Q_00235 [Paenibacillus sp. GCM10023252]|uniref:hypothetical protein n=1 Tax=Paenibacillus sp. GCM10023252 TaxID=3252649 RepID=UPI00361FECF0